MVENGVLDVIFREIKHRFHSLRIKREIGLLLGNLALEESAHEGMVEQGNSSLYFNSESVPSRFSLELSFIVNTKGLSLYTWFQVVLCATFKFPVSRFVS